MHTEECQRQAFFRLCAQRRTICTGVRMVCAEEVGTAAGGGCISAEENKGTKEGG